MENLTATRPARKQVEDIQPIPEALLAGAIEYAISVRGTSHMLSNEEAKAWLYKRMGWN